MYDNWQSSFWNWILSSNGAGWIFGIVGTFFSLYTIFSRKRPSVVEINELENISLVHIRPSLKKLLKVSFKNKDVNNLAQIKLVIYNKGSEVAKDIELVVRFKNDTKILYSELYNKSLSIGIKSIIKQNMLIIKLPFINSLKEHHQKILLTIVVDGDSIFKVDGMGYNWSSKVNYLESFKYRIKFMTWLMFVIIPYEFIYYKIVAEPQLYLDPNEISLRALVISLPLFIPLLFVYIYFFKVMKRSYMFTSILSYRRIDISRL